MTPVVMTIAANRIIAITTGTITAIIITIIAGGKSGPSFW
jgi:hypothetical protein